MIEHFSKFPILIGVVLYKSNYLDNKIIACIKSKCNILFKSDTLITVASEEVKNVLVQYFEKEIVEVSHYPTDKVHHAINSAYQLYSSIVYYSNLMMVNIRISNQENFSRVSENESGKYISLDIKIEKCLINFDRIFTNDDLIEFNQLLFDIGLSTGLYTKKYFYIKSSEFLNMVYEFQESEKYKNLIERIINILTDRIKNDEPQLVIVTDNLV